MNNRKILRGLWFRSFFLQTGFNYERMQALGWCWAISPFLKRLSIDDKSGFYQDNLESFNANPYISTYAVGAVAKLEEEKKDRETILRLKNSLRGPLGSLGDNLIWKGVRPALLTLGIITSGWFGWWGAALFLVLFNGFQIYLRRRGLKKGYQLGEQIFKEFSGNFWRKAPQTYGALGAVLLGLMLTLKLAEYLTWGKEYLAIFLIAVAVSVFGFLRRIPSFDVFLLSVGGGLIIKILAGIL